MFATIRETHALFQSLVSGPNDLPPGDGPYGNPVSQGDLWGDYSAVGSGVRGNLCAPEQEGMFVSFDIRARDQANSSCFVQMETHASNLAERNPKTKRM
jgi:hypothetical protein